MDTDAVTAPFGWNNIRRHWFEDRSPTAREEFARTFCDQVFLVGEQACVVVSYPRPGGRLAYYDMDAGVIHWAQLEYVQHLPKVRRTDETDYTRSAIMASALCDEAADLWSFVEAIREMRS